MTSLTGTMSTKSGTCTHGDQDHGTFIDDLEMNGVTTGAMLLIHVQQVAILTGGDGTLTPTIGT